MSRLKFITFDEGAIKTQEELGLDSSQMIARFSVISQSTGVLDRDAKEIYEGYILKVQSLNWSNEPFRYAVVRFMQNTGAVQCFFPTDPYIFMHVGECNYRTHTKEIVGNVFESPDFDFGRAITSDNGSNFNMSEFISSFSNN